jgi:hypothetical protein
MDVRTHTPMYGVRDIRPRLAPTPGHTRPSLHREPSMSRYLAPLGFTLATVWVAIIFVLVSH